MKKTALILFVCAALCAGAYAQSVVARVNGEPITKAEVQKKLWNAYSAQTIDVMVIEKLIMQTGKSLKISPDQKEVQSRFEAMASRFRNKSEFDAMLKARGLNESMLKEAVKMEMILRQAVIKQKNIVVSDADAQNFFDQNKDRYGEPEMVKLRQIVVKDKAIADALKLTAGAPNADFAKIASEQSIDEETKARGGDLGFIPLDSLPGDIAKSLSALKVGEVSDTIATPEGFVIIKLEDRKPAKPAVFDEWKEKIKAGLYESKIAEAAPAYIEELKKSAKIVMGSAPAAKPSAGNAPAKAAVKEDAGPADQSKAEAKPAYVDFRIPNPEDKQDPQPAGK